MSCRLPSCLYRDADIPCPVHPPMEPIVAMPKQKPGRSKQDYETPKDLLDAIRKRLAIREFKFDFACSMKNKKAPRGWTEKDNSLSRRGRAWAAELPNTYDWGWLNPPFANIGVWVRKCNAAMVYDANIALLVPASVGSNWFRDYIWEKNGVTVLFLNGRPSFDGIAGYPKDCMLVLFESENRFDPRTFKTDVWTWKETDR